MKNVYTVFDRKANSYMTPFFAVSDGVALRILTELVTDPQHQFCQYSEDFVLFKVALYHEQSGQMEPISPAKLVMNMHELKAMHTDKAPPVAGPFETAVDLSSATSVISKDTE